MCIHMSKIFCIKSCQTHKLILFYLLPKIIGDVVSWFIPNLQQNTHKQVEQSTWTTRTQEQAKDTPDYLPKFGFTSMNLTSPLRSSQWSGSLSITFLTSLQWYLTLRRRVRASTNFLWLTTGTRARRATPCHLGGLSSKSNRSPQVLKDAFALSCSQSPNLVSTLLSRLVWKRERGELL